MSWVELDMSIDGISSFFCLGMMVSTLMIYIRTPSPRKAFCFSLIGLNFEMF